MTLLPLILSSPLYADTQEMLDTAEKAIVDLKESSRPVFEESQVKPPSQPADPFLEKIRRRREAFLQKQMSARRKFFGKIREKKLTTEEEEKAIAKFHQKQMGRLEKFMGKQQKQMDKHFNKE